MYTHISSYILLIKKYMELTVCCYCLQTRIVYMNYCANLTTETEDIILLPISGACSAESVPQNFITSGFRVVLRRAYTQSTKYENEHRLKISYQLFIKSDIALIYFAYMKHTCICICIYFLFSCICKF